MVDFTVGFGSGPSRSVNDQVPLNSFGLPMNPLPGQPGSEESRAAAQAQIMRDLEIRKAARAAMTERNPNQFSLTGFGPNGVTNYDTTNQPYNNSNNNLTNSSGNDGLLDQSNIQTQGNQQFSLQQQKQMQPQPMGKFGSSQQTQGKGSGQTITPPSNTTPAPMQTSGKSGVTTNSVTSGQPTFGQPNRYPNTVGQWDNANIQRQSPTGGGKGKG